MLTFWKNLSCFQYSALQHLPNINFVPELLSTNPRPSFQYYSLICMFPSSGNRLTLSSNEVSTSPLPFLTFNNERVIANLAPKNGYPWASLQSLLCKHLRSALLLADPYVKVWLMHKDKRVEKKKTVVMKRCLNPVFNESFPFDVPAHVLRETTIIITVMDKDRLSRNDVIGKVTQWLSAS